MRVFLAAVLSAMAAPSANAQSYPERPITLLVPFAAGGGTDVTARTLGQALEKILPGKVVVVNRPGAGGGIALAELAQAKPDGYTIGIVNTPGVITIPIERSVPFSIDTFEFIAAVVDSPATIAVLPDNPVKTIADLVAAAKSAPGKVTVGTQGVGSAGHISLLMLEAASGVRFNYVPFGGAAPARTALLARDIVATTANLDESLQFTQAGPFRTLGVMAANRSAAAPELPTFKESGYDLDTGSLRGIAGPRALPKESVARLGEAIARALKEPEFQELARKTFQPLRYMPREQYLAELQSVDRRLRALWKVNPWTQ
ncbi:MAG: tripartite tricarboxylate transporter substrate binding protein [Proteobacteria bacterium]|nr:tripartite tricarboxylate transporter substrate binding protein [Burkholderiales bacterium]